VPEKRHTKESIVRTLQNLAQRLGTKSLTKKDVQKVIPVSSVKYLFGNLGNALEAAGLERRTGWEQLKGDVRKSLTDDELFRSVFEVEGKVGHEPGSAEYSAHGKYSPKPFKRLGKWADVIARYRKWKTGHGERIAEHEEIRLDDLNTVKAVTQSSVRPMALARPGAAPLQLYGEPIDFRGLRHAPINEQGVVYLFGMVSRELGFNIEAIQQGFPDCEGKYLHDPKKNLWAKARIEFEFRASSFEDHGHDPKQCDFIVCWINDWPDSPIRVIELKREILRLPS
jgi:hypothetical protein